MDVMTAYLYGLLDSDMYMKVPDGISIPDTRTGCNMFFVKFTKSLYDLKQLGRMWYNQLKEFFLNKGYSNSDDCPCVFIRKSSIIFCIISVYVDDLHIIDNTQDINEAYNHIMMEFEMKDLGKTKFWLVLQFENLPKSIPVHQSAYIQKVLEKFSMNKAYLSKIPMIVHAFEVDTNPFKSCEEGEEVLDLEFPYSNDIGALIYYWGCGPKATGIPTLKPHLSNEPSL
jgi:hypothetical protein